jgi:hypothetical protein
MFRVSDGWRKCALAVLLYVAAGQTRACAPLEPREPSGFARAGVGHLPKNARGVMFYPGARTPRPQDFAVTSTEDTRPLSLRVHAFKGSAWVRLEPVPGFQPGARYRFRYIAAHGALVYPDEMTVAIDDEAVSSEGDYAIELAPAPAYKVVVVPTSSGSCVEPSPAVVQAFTYRVPASVLRYRDALAYATDVARVSQSGASMKPPPFVLSWTALPSLYDTGHGSLGMGFSKQYTARDNAVVAACGTRWPRVRLTGSVSFPELDALDHRTPAVEFDLDRNIEGRCDPLESLLRTVNRQAPEPGLREVCRMMLPGTFSVAGRPLRAVAPMEWAFELSSFTNMSATCNLVALAYLWHLGQYSTQPDTLNEIGAAIAEGFQQARPADRDAAVHALAYLTDQLPRESARQLLAPVQAMLAAMLAEPRPDRADELAKLIELAAPGGPGKR